MISSKIRLVFSLFNSEILSYFFQPSPLDLNIKNKRREEEAFILFFQSVNLLRHLQYLSFEFLNSFPQHIFYISIKLLFWNSIDTEKLFC